MSGGLVYLTKVIHFLREADRRSHNKKNNRFVRMLKCACQFQGTLEHAVQCCSFKVNVHLDQTQSGGPSLVGCRRACTFGMMTVTISAGRPAVYSNHA